MLTRNLRVRCDYCGKFVSDLELGPDGIAKHSMLIPDSDRSVEEYESICTACVKLGYQLTQPF